MCACVRSCTRKFLTSSYWIQKKWWNKFSLNLLRVDPVSHFSILFHDFVSFSCFVSFISSISISSKKLHQMPWSVQQEEAPGVTKRGDETVVIKITLRGKWRRGGYVPKSSKKMILTNHIFWNFAVQWLVLLFGDDTIYIYILYIWYMIYDFWRDTWFIIHDTLWYDLQGSACNLEIESPICPLGVVSWSELTVDIRKWRGG